jgi:agmatinase
MYGSDVTFLGVDACDLTDPASYKGADVVIIGAPFDGGTSYRAGARFGPNAVRQACYLEHDGSRPHLALRVDGLKDLRVVDAGDVEMYSGDVEKSCAALEKVVEEVSKSGAFPLVIGGDHTITWPNATGLARARGWGRLGVIHFDAHADTGNVTFGSLVGHGQPMRRLIESGAVRGDRFLQVGLRGYWPEAETLSWMAAQGMRSFEMSEITTKGLANCLDEVIRIATDDCDGVFLSVDVDVVDPGSAPGTGTPEPGGLTSREVLDAVRKITLAAPVIGMDVVEVSPPYDHADITALLASRVALEALSALAKKQGGEKHDPGQPLLSNR